MPSGQRLDSRDLVFALLRVAALVAGVTYAFLSVPAGPVRIALLKAFAVFGAYTVVLYAALFRLLAAEKTKRAFYLLAAAADLALVVALLLLSGGSESPLVRALFLWVAVLAFYFGTRVGLVCSLAAFAVLFGFHLAEGFRKEAFTLIVESGAVLMHGPLIGFVADRERRRAEQLREASDRISAAQQRLRDEQAKVVHAEKLSAIGLLAAGVAHEINNPLAGVMSCTKALRDSSVPEERRGEYFDAVAEGLERIRATVQGLLDFARQRPPSFAREDAAEIVAACVRLLHPLERKKGLTLKNELATGRLLVLADRGQLMQAVVNVLMNAIQAVQTGGRIILTGREEPGRVGIHIQDDGDGMPPEVVGKACEPFFTTKPPGEGTGLGLAITLGILRAHGGDLAIESEPGKGTSVTLWLPRERQA